MRFTPDEILGILDDCCNAFTFPMLDNGYVYLAASRLSCFRSAVDWALVIEVFGFSPRLGLPDLGVHTFASALRDRDPMSMYATSAAYDNYLAHNPNNESRFIHPIAEGEWLDVDDGELVAAQASEVPVRGNLVRLPALSVYGRHGIDLIESPRVHVFELCRFLAAVARDDVLAMTEERRISIPTDMTQLLVLDEWNHPDIARDGRPSRSESFQQLAQVLCTRDDARYKGFIPNTHWRNWPDGGQL